MKKPKVGVVVLTYNAEQLIEECLNSLQKNDYTNFEIVVVDNNSKDNTVKKVKKMKIHTIQTGSNLGYAGGNNIGIKHFTKIGTEYILLLNPDTIVSGELLTKLINAIEADKSIGVIGPMITYVNQPKKIWFAGGYFNKIFCYTRHPQMNKSIKEINRDSGEVDFITGACMLIRTSILEQTGLIPEEYFLYFEDAFFCQKVKEKGFKNYLLAIPLVQHYVSASTGKIGSNEMTPLRAYYYARNPLIYIKKKVKGKKKFTNYIGQFTIRFPRYLLQMSKEKNLQAIEAYLHGIWDGLRK